MLTDRTAMAIEAWDQARRLLVIRLDALGDVLMTTPAWRALKERRPDRRLTLMTSPLGAEAAPFIPEIDETLIYEAPWMKASVMRKTSEEDRAMADTLRGKRFDGAVIFTVYSQNPLPSALLCYWADIPLRLAYCHENPYHLLTDWISDPEPQRGWRHEVRRQLDLVKEIGCRTENTRLSFHVRFENYRKVEKRLDAIGIDRKSPWIVLHPGASAPSRRYPANYFSQVVYRLARERGVQVILTGTADEEDTIQEIRQQCDVQTWSLSGELSLGDLAALIQTAPLLVTNNTGPAHIAAAVGTPVVDLYALTNPQHTPWGVVHRVLFQDVPCKFCYKSVCPEGHHRCLKDVSPERVVTAIDELLGEQYLEPENPYVYPGH